MADIRLHPQYGVNPTIPVCFWCGEDKNEIAMLGAACKGEAPRHMLMDYNPCEKCQAAMDQGITLIEVQPKADSDLPAISKEGVGSSLSPTGRFVVVKAEVLPAIFTNPEGLKAAEEHGKALIDAEAFRILFGHLKP